ncbi:hypothetical protein BC938DRAFT_481739 [Jimgerdemannia flammicorona]|nr:hypothetical protein BC938DRAFT_481739 [Jimgerdemannia flammicorona]
MPEADVARRTMADLSGVASLLSKVAAAATELLQSQTAPHADQSLLEFLACTPDIGRSLESQLSGTRDILNSTAQSYALHVRNQRHREINVSTSPNLDNVFKVLEEPDLFVIQEQASPIHVLVRDPLKAAKEKPMVVEVYPHDLVATFKNNIAARLTREHNMHVHVNSMVFQDCELADEVTIRETGISTAAIIDIRVNATELTEGLESLATG